MSTTSALPSESDDVLDGLGDDEYREPTRLERRQELESWTMEQLRFCLESDYDLPTRGAKAELVRRILAHEFTAHREAEGIEILRQLYDYPLTPIAVDTETTGLQVADGRSRCIGISIAAIIETAFGRVPVAHYFPTGHPVDDDRVTPKTLQMLHYVLRQEGRWLIWFNVQFDVLALETVGIYVGDVPFWDVPTMSMLIDENMPYQRSLEALATHYLGEGQGKVETPLVKKEKRTGWPTTTTAEMWDYAVGDTVATWRVWNELMQHREWRVLPEEIWESKQRLIRVLTEMRRRGVRINTALAAEQEAIGAKRMEELKAELGMNPSSINDMRHLMIDVLKLPVLKESKKTKQPSFDKTVMPLYEEMLERDGRREAQLISAYRGWSKAVTAAYRPYLALLSPDGRLRATFNTHRTVTGRLSSSEPNLQQIPKTSDKEWNGRVKECFIAREGYSLVEFDYSQLELRLAAAYAGEDRLKQVFNEGRDIFDEMSLDLGMERPDTKVLVYTIQYGGGVPRLVVVFGVSEPRAAQIRQNFYDTYPALRALAERVDARAKAEKRVRLWSGRFRHFRYANESYKALNSIMQGGGADIVERVMIRAYDEIDDNDSTRVLLQVHDSLVWEIRDDLLETQVPRIKALMEDVAWVNEEIGTAVRFNVDAKVLGRKDAA